MNAYKFAMLEHKTSRLLFAMLIITYFVAVAENYKLAYAIDRSVPLLIWLLRIDIILWLAYYLFHTLEKKAFKSQRK